MRVQLPLLLALTSASLLSAATLSTVLMPGCGDSEEASPDIGPAARRAEGAASAAGEEEAPAEPVDEGPPKRIFAKRFVANVREAPSSDAPRIGYLRAGAVLAAKGSRPVATDEDCGGGFFELSTGGFVCDGRDVIAFDGQRLPEVRAAQPDREARLPYQYGYARRDDTPVYRDLPTDEEAAEFEGYRIPGAEPPASVQPGEGAGGLGAGADEAAAPPAEMPGATPPAAAVPAGIGGAEGAPAVGEAGAAAAEGEGDAEEAEEEGPPTLESLQGERHSILLRRMMKGFYVSLDRDFRSGRRRYWRTQQHEFIPYHSLGLRSGSDFAGVELADATALPVGYVLSSKTLAYTRREDGRIRRGRPPGYHHRFGIVGEEEIRGEGYYVGDDERVYRVRDITRIDARPRPEEVGEGEKWIDVDLTTQVLVAYEGDRPVFATLISSGIIVREEVPELNHATPPGTYRIRAKHLATTMDGDNAFDGPYSIQDVPYVMYYEQGFALHSAFWHDLFGRTKSHGCINLSPLDARWIFRWSGPHLPEGWHGVYPTEDDPGTVLIIRGETPLRRR